MRLEVVCGTQGYLHMHKFNDVFIKFIAKLPQATPLEHTKTFSSTFAIHLRTKS